jgi:hypothetical protein
VPSADFLLHPITKYPIPPYPERRRVYSQAHVILSGEGSNAFSPALETGVEEPALSEVERDLVVGFGVAVA